MPIYIYKSKSKEEGCSYCREGLEWLHREEVIRPLEKCPKCGAMVMRIFGNFSLGFSRTTLDSRAKAQGFHKLKRVDKGKYEKLY